MISEGDGSDSDSHSQDIFGLRIDKRMTLDGSVRAPPYSICSPAKSLSESDHFSKEDDDALLAAVEDFEGVKATGEVAPAEAVTTGEEVEVDIGGQVFLDVSGSLLEAWSVDKGLQPWPVEEPMLPNQGEVVEVLGEVQTIDQHLYNQIMVEAIDDVQAEIDEGDLDIVTAGKIARENLKRRKMMLRQRN